MNELKNEIEALLFSAGRKISGEELSKLCKDSINNIKSAIIELKKQYDGMNSSLIIIEEGDGWRLAVRESFIPLVHGIVTEIELSKALIETLAVIAYKYPVLQSEVIKIRSSNAYQHLKELEELGYLTRTKHGRTNKITLTQRFFEYFELPKEKLKEHFKAVEDVVKTIESKGVPTNKSDQSDGRSSEEQTKLVKSSPTHPT